MCPNNISLSLNKWYSIYLGKVAIYLDNINVNNNVILSVMFGKQKRLFHYSLCKLSFFCRKVYYILDRRTDPGLN